MSARQPITAVEQHLFHEGTLRHAWRKLGAHAGKHQGVSGFWFATWAPRADAVDVVGDFNGWASGVDPLVRLTEGGIWQGFVAGAKVGHRYKFRLTRQDRTFDKADPYARATEEAPATASVLTASRHRWGDAKWMTERRGRQQPDAPISIYELHPGSWLRPGGRLPRWRDVTEPLVRHLTEHGFTHVELLPVMEHPYYGSWGYQVTGYFAPSARFGHEDELRAFIDALHQAGIGVILDFVPAHFPRDDWALATFDGEPLYEHPDPRRGAHPDWGTLIFDYGRPEVQTFLRAAALYWLTEFHADGLRFDAVASMLYLDYSRPSDGWLPNVHGGHENLEAIALLQAINRDVYEEHPDIQTWAEESTAWPGVSRPTDQGGLGFGYKWDMGWMHDTLAYLSKDPLHRRHHHERLTFRTLYAGAENFVLPLSHDEVVHGKGSLLGKMHGDDWQRRANLRLLFASQWATPGKKLLFMGGELGQAREWSHEREIDWALLDQPGHQAIAKLIAQLNALYRAHPALHAGDCSPDGFAWLWGDDAASSVVSFRRIDTSGQHPDVVIVLHYTPIPRPNYPVPVPVGGTYDVLLNTDDATFGGTNLGSSGAVETVDTPLLGHAHTLVLDLPPLGALWLRARTGSA
jgi:1,4-alpha-glucan branching enzyme